MLAAGGGSSQADDLTEWAAHQTLPHVLLFSGAELGSYGAFLHGGALWSPEGLYASGFTFKMLTGVGTYRYAAGVFGSVNVQGRAGLASFMPGWRIKYEKFEVTGFVGLDMQDHRQTPFDPFARVRGAHAGVRVGADLWYEPAQSLMLASNVSVSSIGTSYWTRVAGGTRIFDRYWLGLEALALGGPDYQEYRFGLHVTGLRLGPLEWSGGGGVTVDSDDRRGLYGRLGVLMRR